MHFETAGGIYKKNVPKVYLLTITRNLFDNFELYEKSLKKKKNLKVIPTVSDMIRDFAKADHRRLATDSLLHAQPLQGCCVTKYGSVSCRSVVQEAHKRILCFRRVQKANALIDNFVSNDLSCCYMVVLQNATSFEHGYTTLNDCARWLRLCS